MLTGTHTKLGWELENLEEPCCKAPIYIYIYIYIYVYICIYRYIIYCIMLNTIIQSLQIYSAHTLGTSLKTRWHTCKIHVSRFIRKSFGHILQISVCGHTISRKSTGHLQPLWRWWVWCFCLLKLVAQWSGQLCWRTLCSSSSPANPLASLALGTRQAGHTVWFPL